MFVQPSDGSPGGDCAENRGIAVLKPAPRAPANALKFFP
jgi:hypothetical protein